MLFKLSLKNIRKSIKDYAIYFFTLILGVAIFYIFNALDSQTVMLDVTENTHDLIDLMMQLLSGVSVFVSFILGFLIIYASRFLIKRRSKEFGIYLTLGMSKRKISLILFLETLIIGILSLAVGLGIGVALSQVMSLVVANMFEANLTKFAFVFSAEACAKTAIYFSIMYLIVMVFNTIVVSRCKLIDLLDGAKKSEKIKLKNPILCVLVFIVAAVVLGRAYYIVTNDFLTLQTPEDIMKPIAMGVAATFFIFWSLSGLILRIVSSIKSLYYRGLNSFTLRQFSSKVNTTVFSTTIICLMLFVTICLLSSCFTIKNSMNANINELSPVDVMFVSYRNNVTGEPMTPVEVFKTYDYDILAQMGDHVEVTVYATEDLTMNDTLGSRLEGIRTSFPFLAYDTLEPIMKISDYNKVAHLYGIPEYTLGENQYMIVADFESMVNVRNIALENEETIKVFGHTLEPKYVSCQYGFVEMSSNHINTGIILVSDDIVDEDAVIWNALIGDYKASTAKEKAAIEAEINELSDDGRFSDGTYLSGSSRISIKEATVGLSAMVTFIGLYLGVIFLISSAAILALKELSESSDNRIRFSMLRKIGTDEKIINRALFRQIAIFFLLPLVLALIHSVFGIMFAMNILEIFGNEQLLPSVIMTAVFIVLIYGGYFLITYYCSKSIIKKRV